MAQNITLLGAQYNDVPAVQLPKTGGGTARFDDASITTAVASDVAQGKVFIASDGTITTGTASGGAVIIQDTTDVHGGTIREITATDVVNLQGGKTVTPSTSSQTVTPDTGYDAFESVTVSAMPSGTAGTPTATKGTVSNHSVSVTPSVTNTTGYITGGTKTGTAVTVSASELVSGSQTITTNNTYNVTDLASVIVNVSGGGGSSWELVTSKEIQVSTTSTSVTDIEWWDTGKTELWTSSKAVYVRIRDKVGKRTGYFYGTDNYILNAYAIDDSSSSTTNIARNLLYCNSQGYYRVNTGAYGIYISALEDTGSIRLVSRYSSSYGTIDSTYTVEVYLLSPPTGKPYFE